jgi:hypothetical protein
MKHPRNLGSFAVKINRKRVLRDAEIENLIRQHAVVIGLKINARYQQLSLCLICL